MIFDKVFYTSDCLRCSINVLFLLYVAEMANEDSGSVGFTIDEKTLQSVEIQDEPEEQGRDRWSRKIEFLFACIGFCVGYGNIWRFPYMCFKNGGGMVLINRSINQASDQASILLISQSISQSVNRPTDHQSINELISQSRR